MSLEGEFSLHPRNLWSSPRNLCGTRNVSEICRCMDLAPLPPRGLNALWVYESAQVAGKRQQITPLSVIDKVASSETKTKLLDGAFEDLGRFGIFRDGCCWQRTWKFADWKSLDMVWVRRLYLCERRSTMILEQSEFQRISGDQNGTSHGEA